MSEATSQTTHSHAPVTYSIKTDDPYPSRDGKATRFVPRREPVLHGSAEGRGAAAGPLRAEQLASLERDGFLIVPSLLGREEVAALKGALDHALRSVQGGAEDGVIRERGKGEVRSIFAVHDRDDAIGALASDPRLSGIARQVLGDDVYVHQSRVNFKPALVGEPFSWHSDFETWHAEDGMPAMRAISASVLLTDNHVWNGPLMLIPGSHRTFVTCTTPTPDDHFLASLVSQRVGSPSLDAIARLFAEAGERIETAVGPAGTVVFFDCNTMHASGSNLSPLPRSNVFVVYNALSNQLGEPFAAPRHRPEFLGARKPKIVR